MKKSLLKITSVVLGLSMLFSSLPTFAATVNQSDLDPTFNLNITPVGFNGPYGGTAPSMMVKQSDGKFLAVGYFTSYNGMAAPRIARLNADLSFDPSFSGGAGFTTVNTRDVSSVAIQSDGKVLVGGLFTAYQGVSRSGLVRTNSDGSIDTSFNPIGFTNGGVGRMKVQTDGKILVSGTFTYQGVTKRLIRLNSDGSVDTSFTMGAFNDSVVDMAIDANGKIIVGGYFATYEGLSANRIIRLNADGSRDTAFDMGVGFDKSVRTMAIDANGKYVLGGVFSTYKGVSANKIIRLNTDGSRDTSFNMGGGIPGNGDDCVYSLAIDANGKITITGYFNSYNGSLAYKIARINPDGSIDTTFNMGDGFGPMITYPQGVVLTSDGKVIILGNTFQYKGIGTPPGMNTINSDGSRDRTKQNITSGFDTPSGNGTIRAVAIQTDGKTLVGGWFKTYNKTLVNGLIRLNSDGSRDTSFDIGAGFNIGTYDGYLNTRWITSIAVQTDGKILVGGGFTTYQGVSANKIIRLNTDGTRDTSFNIGVGFDNGQYTQPNKIIVQSNGKILVIGSCTSYQGVAIRNIARLNTDGSLDTSFTIGSSFNGSVDSIAINSNDQIIAVGQFTSYNGTPVKQVAVINANGTLDSTFNPGTSFGDGGWYPSSIDLQNGGFIVGGNLNTYQGVRLQNKLIRLNTDGSRDTSFSLPSSLQGNTIIVAGIQSDGKILISSPKFLRLNQNGSVDTSFLSESDTSFAGGGASVAAIGPDGNIFIGGTFTSYKGIPKGQMIRLNGTLVAETPGALPVFLSDTQIIAYLLKTKKTVDPKWLFMGTIPLYF